MIIPKNSDEELETGVLTSNGRYGGRGRYDEVLARWLTEVKNS
jgi:hypothetical protein